MKRKVEIETLQTDCISTTHPQHVVKKHGLEATIFNFANFGMPHLEDETDNFLVSSRRRNNSESSPAAAVDPLPIASRNLKSRKTSDSSSSDKSSPSSRFRSLKNLLTDTFRPRSNSDSANGMAWSPRRKHASCGSQQSAADCVFASCESPSPTKSAYLGPYGDHDPSKSRQKRISCDLVLQCESISPNFINGNGTNIGNVLLPMPTIRQGCALESEKKARKLSSSPIGMLVTRLRNLSGGGGGAKLNSSSHSANGFCDVQSPEKRNSLPDPALMPQAASCYEDFFQPAAAQRVRKMSYPPVGQSSSVKERHRDLFEEYGLSPRQNISPLNSVYQPQRMSSVKAKNSNIHVTENEKYIIFKERHHSASIVESGLDDICQESLQNPDTVFATFMRHHTCYDLMPVSSKVVVFDTMLNVKKAFFALVYNGVRAAPVWDSNRHAFVGMLTITDFINILHKYYKSSIVPIDELENHQITTWRQVLFEKLPSFTSIDPEATLYDAVEKLITSKVHRLPVIDVSTGNVMHILTHKRVLKFISFYIDSLPLPEWFTWPLRKINIGTYNNVAVVRSSLPLIRVLNLFVERRVSALPVVDEDNRLEDIYSKFDVINLAATKSYNNLDITVKEALAYRKDRFEGVTTCTLDDSLQVIIHRIVTAEVHRLVVIDNCSRVLGVVSLSDLLTFLMRRTPTAENSNKSANEPMKYQVHESMDLD